jgi:hypothetical protein
MACWSLRQCRIGEEQEDVLRLLRGTANEEDATSSFSSSASMLPSL